MSKKGVLAYLALGCSIAALIAVVGDSRQIGEEREREGAARTRPRSIRERMLEERESTAMGSRRAEGATDTLMGNGLLIGTDFLGATLAPIRRINVSWSGGVQ